MTDMTYDPEADAVYVYLARGKIAETAEIKPGLIVDYDRAGRILGLEILGASRQLAPGEWSSAQRPGATARHSDAAE